MKIFDLKPTNNDVCWKLEPAKQNSPYPKVVQEEQAFLTVKSVGEVFIRCFPCKFKEGYSFAFLPENSFREDCQETALRLDAVDQEGELHFSGAREIVLKKHWNDGHWMKLADYLRAINGIEEKPIPSRNFYREGAKRRRRL